MKSGKEVLLREHCDEERHPNLVDIVQLMIIHQITLTCFSDAKIQVHRTHYIQVENVH